MDYYAQIKINPYLEPNEELIWAGQPQTGIKFRKSDILFIPFSILWTIYFAVTAWIYHVYTTVAFFLVGLYMMIGRFIVDAKYRTRVYYGLTDTRVIILRGYFKRKVDSVFLKEIGDITISIRTDGSGIITLVPGHQLLNLMISTPHRLETRFTPTRLEFLSDAKPVYDEILQAQKNALTAAGLI